MATNKPFRRQFKKENSVDYIVAMTEASNWSQLDRVKELVKSGSISEQEAAWDYLCKAEHYTEELIALAGRVSRLNIAEAVRQAAEKYFDSQPAKTMNGVKMQ